MRISCHPNDMIAPTGRGRKRRRCRLLNFRTHVPKKRIETKFGSDEQQGALKDSCPSPHQEQRGKPSQDR